MAHPAAGESASLVPFCSLAPFYSPYFTAALRSPRAPIATMSNRSNPIAVSAPLATPPDAPPDAPPLTPAQRRTLRAAAALVIPASAEFGGVPGADDPLICADIEQTLGPDRPAVQLALEKLDAAASGPLADQAVEQREAAGRWLREHEPTLATTFGNLVVACYYRDDRVMRSIGLEPRPPYPQGFEVEPGDYAALLEPVRARGRLWRNVE
jgi:hypothetical protein